MILSYYGLNSRFNGLLYNQCRLHRLNFKSSSRHIFERICREHLPLIVDRVVALSLSAGKENPQQIESFCSSFPSFSPLTQLRSLTIFSIHSSEKMLQITQNCSELINLTHLIFNSCYALDGRDLEQEILNNIWNLPKLSHCELGIGLRTEWHNHCTPTIISTSLESLSFSKFTQLGTIQSNTLSYTSSFPS